MIVPVAILLLGGLILYSGMHNVTVADALGALLGRAPASHMGTFSALEGVGTGSNSQFVSLGSGSINAHGARAGVVSIARNQVGQSGYTYSETRPMPHSLPGVTDCSGFVTLVYKAAGAADPNGMGYDGYGYTGTLIRNGQSTTNPQPGDLCFWRGPDHVAIYVGGGKCIGFGSPPSPIQDSVAAETQYHSSFAGYRSYL